MEQVTPAEIESGYRKLRELLLAERHGASFWTGELSSSALATATAVSALACVRDAAGVASPRSVQPTMMALIRNGLNYLAEHQNADGGWGDTEKSHSNIATSMLAQAAFYIAGVAGEYLPYLEKSDIYIKRAGGVAGVRARYGKDKTFAVPILMTSALAGAVEWSEVDELPFELACFPPRLFATLRLPVVSYALPALIAIGLVRYIKRPPANLFHRLLRRLTIGKALRRLESIQPSSGGFLEATPLTSFVTMALAGSGRVKHPVTQKAVEFLIRSVRPDGSWPIDSNLSCWLTTLAVNALGTQSDLKQGDLPEAGLPEAGRTRDWILACQFRQLHPYTNAAPGGWGWTDLPGSVPDADDTAGALLTLKRLPTSDAVAGSVRLGTGWLLDLQNRDGGWPTFCRGWTNLPFDRSGSDLTAHVLRALAVWRNESGQSERVDRAIGLGFRYLGRNQARDGSWLPLWFGNQAAPGESNPVYGTARVLLAYYELGRMTDPAAQRGCSWLCLAQNGDGGWGGVRGTPSSVEETALAVGALLGSGRGGEIALAASRGLRWLLQRVNTGSVSEPAPIGLYFAKLWYFERLYPLIFSAEAFNQARRPVQTNPPSEPALTQSDAPVADSK